ncbi:hypothetical protein NDU88_012510 [Pleurodeles waltl]|uniref:Uncharacterized protein n=1 Tax=Pleurodeles waltl TaxID=8319 RepID=A0AAV7R418_PLEWA|nr:hypothetical protein NDU88_012510 [Pleurodeles waltl]
MFYSACSFVPYSKRICHKLLCLAALETEKKGRPDWRLSLNNDGAPLAPLEPGSGVAFRKPPLEKKSRKRALRSRSAARPVVCAMMIHSDLSLF